MIRRIAYADGASFRPPRGMTAEIFPSRHCQAVLDLDHMQDWPSLWKVAQRHLAGLGFHKGSLRVYRQVLRSFKCFSEERSLSRTPREAVPQLRPFLDDLVAREASASWLSSNISVLRTVFDKLAGNSFTTSLRSPKKHLRLPEVLSEGEVARLIRATPTARDRLLAGFLYGCGMKIGEVCNLRWSDLDPKEGLVRVIHTSPDLTRALPLPASMRPLLEKGKTICGADDYVFPGGKKNPNLTARTVERMIRKAAETAGITKIVTCMTLRHSYAFHRLKAGDNVRSVQEDLGHRNIEATLIYQAFIYPAETIEAVNQRTSRACRAVRVVSRSDSATAESKPAEPCKVASSASIPDSAEQRPHTWPAACNLELFEADAVFPLAEFSLDWRTYLACLKSRMVGRFLCTRARATP